ncbi:putative inositol monophosphatase protein [Lasiodiplodia theobromae]|uniref:Inositol-1-monophosphatase n=1 Tax=Lasiodiplodia theobromae TaxID=45133 RepID=A0A5N5CX41_9PEZI|nr:Inositol monophosphatase [Lasiodiplodia theobromae]KAB2569937.1 Protein QA-X [Lasiodiplodia theobromae]KAF4535064.1 Inositol monophosphatase [Lasiodiplodia theobromae]KAF9631584.1 putative inositol monophosphatase protein [Lasiodiplodia theobromae]
MAANLSSKELDDIYSFAIQLGKDAGKMLLEAAMLRCKGGIAENTAHVEKMNAVDLVTQTDEDVEAFVKNSITKKFPAHKFIGEETYSKGTSKDYLVNEEPTWIVDPLDGTVNYIHLFPMFCVSIAFVHNHVPTIGVIYAPFLNQLFTACRGRGAWLNETQQLPLIRNPIPPMPAKAPSGCVFSCEWGKDRRDSPEGNMHRKIESFVNMAAEVGGRGGKGGMVHGVRSLGSATLDLAYTAMGSFDIWWEGGCWEWDVAAGICILQEAGGLVTTANPPENPATATIEDVRLGSRLYLAIRPAGPSENGESGRESQERTVREVWRRVRHLDYTRPGA